MKLATAMMLGASAVALSGCTGFPARVSRYNAMPAAAGQSFFVVPANPANSGGLEFTRYGSLVANAMQAQGYAPAASASSATMLVRVDYGVDEGTAEVRSYPSTMGYGFYSPYRHWYYPRYGYWGGYSPFYYGWNDPFYGGYGSEIDTYTVYKSFLDVDIRRRVDNAALFEGHARARSGTDDLTRIVPNLVTAMFTGFPGNNGETIKITVPRQRKATATASY